MKISLAATAALLGVAQAYNGLTTMSTPKVVEYNTPFNLTYTIEGPERTFTQTVGVIIGGIGSDYDNDPRSIGGYLSFIDLHDAVPGTYTHEMNFGADPNSEPIHKATNFTLIHSVVGVVQYAGAFPTTETFRKANITFGDAVSEETVYFM